MTLNYHHQLGKSSQHNLLVVSQNKLLNTPHIPPPNPQKKIDQQTSKNKKQQKTQKLCTKPTSVVFFCELYRATDLMRPSRQQLDM